MGGMVEAQVERALRSFADGDETLASQVCADDRKINRMEVVLDEECRRVLALRQPAASDLRLVVATLKTVTDLERIGDEAQKVSEAAIRLAAQERDGPIFDRIHRLGREVTHMVSGVLDAFARLDARHAVALVQLDFKVDAEHSRIREEVTAAMMEHPDQVPALLDALWTSRALERIGDHVRNVCEYVIFMVHGKDVRHGVLDDIDVVSAGDGGSTGDPPPARTPSSEPTT